MYDVFSNYWVPPCISEGLDQFLALELTYKREKTGLRGPSSDEMNRFFDAFGTHAIRKIGLGASFISLAKYNKHARAEIESKGKSVLFEPRTSAWGEAGQDDKPESKFRTNADIRHIESYSIGPNLPYQNSQIKERLELWVAN